jgi:hypothetical protein
MNATERKALLTLLANHLRTTENPEDTELATRITSDSLTDDDYETLQSVCEMALDDHKMSKSA